MRGMTPATCGVGFTECSCVPLLSSGAQAVREHSVLSLRVALDLGGLLLLLSCLGCLGLPGFSPPSPAPLAGQPKIICRKFRAPPPPLPSLPLCELAPRREALSFPAQPPACVPRNITVCTHTLAEWSDSLLKIDLGAQR